MTFQIIENTFNEAMGYFKIVLENNDNLLLTRNEYGNVKFKENHSHLMFESTSGNFYKPLTNLDNTVYFKQV